MNESGMISEALRILANGKLQRVALVSAMALLMLPAVAPAQMIRLRSQATVEKGQDVRLGDVATVSGADRRTAEDLANTVILSGVESPRKIRAESVLMALVAQHFPPGDGTARGAAGGGELAGSLLVSGAAVCEVKLRDAGGATTGKPARAKAARRTRPRTFPIARASCVA